MISTTRRSSSGAEPACPPSQVADFSHLGPGRLRVESGPVSLVLSATWAAGERPDLLEAGGRRALEVLEELAPLRRLLSLDVREIRSLAALPAAAQAMCRAALPFSDLGVTPLVAVAGAVADEVANFLKDQGASRALVTNGGDVALRLAPGQSASVGLVARLGDAGLTARFRVSEPDGVGGAATSGFGGRSFTLGIADAVTALGSRGAAADAAATLIANAVDLASPEIRRVPAEGLYADTDLAGRAVTVSVGRLEPGEVESALDRGAAAAECFLGRGLIRGAILSLRGRWRFVGFPGQGALEWLESTHP